MRRVTERENESAVISVQDITSEVMTIGRTISVSGDIVPVNPVHFLSIAIFAINCSCYMKVTTSSADFIRKERCKKIPPGWDYV